MAELSKSISIVRPRRGAPTIIIPVVMPATRTNSITLFEKVSQPNGSNIKFSNRGFTMEWTRAARAPIPPPIRLSERLQAPKATAFIKAVPRKEPTKLAPIAISG